MRGGYRPEKTDWKQNMFIALSRLRNMKITPPEMSDKIPYKIRYKFYHYLAMDTRFGFIKDRHKIFMIEVKEDIEKRKKQIPEIDVTATPEEQIKTLLSVYG